MLTKTVVIQNPSGMHARPATLFVQKASGFNGTVNLTKGTKKVNGKSIMGLMSLGVVKGDEVTLEVDGELEAQVLEELVKLLTAIHD